MNTNTSTNSVQNPAATLRRDTAVVWASAGVVVGGLVGFLLGSFVGLVAGVVVVGGIFGFVGSALAGRFVESAIDVVIDRIASQEMTSEEAPRLFNLLQGLCASTGVGAPRVSVTEDDGINALVVADPSRERNAELVVTRGFVQHLERIEMEGAVAVCLARLRSGLVEAQTLAVALAIVAPWFVPAPARRAVAGTLGGQLVFDADMKGAGITRYPPGLAAAFQQMLAGSTDVSGADPRAAVLWLANPTGESDVSGNAAHTDAAGSRVDGSSEERPPLSERLALLREI